VRNKQAHEATHIACLERLFKLILLRYDKNDDVGLDKKAIMSTSLERWQRPT